MRRTSRSSICRPTWNGRRNLVTGRISTRSSLSRIHLSGARTGVSARATCWFPPRHLHRIFIIDRDSGDIVWQWGEGELLGQHQPTMLSNGNILLFDNGWGPPMRGWSQVLEMAPASGEIVWRYRTDPATDFWSPVGSGAQRLPNGNTLICAMNWSEPGRLFEVTPEGDIVWEYWNPEGESFYRAARYERKSPAVTAVLGQ
jgi:hypothetical protein